MQVYVRNTAATLCLWVLPLAVSAQELSLKAVTRSYALTGATVVQAPGKQLANATVLIKDGVIAGVGSGLAIPPGTQVVKADSLFVYAGFIDGLSQAGIPETKASAERPKDPSNPPNALAGIQPERQVRDLLNPGDKAIEEMRKAGFTLAHVVPQGQMLPGKGALVLMAGSSADNMKYIRRHRFLPSSTAQGACTPPP